MNHDAGAMSLKRPTGQPLAEALLHSTGHAFRDFRLMERELTHSRARGQALDNERLEFLGDRVLGLVIYELLFHAFPDASEGQLAVRLGGLVSASACASVAEEIGLPSLIRADAGVKARKSRNVPSDSIEALIAALYLDGGMQAAKAFILRYWEPRSNAALTVLRDPKTELQEWAHQAVGAQPVYAIEAREGPDHEPVFTVSVKVGLLAPGLGQGRSKREAEQGAAAAVLVREGVWTAEGTSA